MSSSVALWLGVYLGGVIAMAMMILAQQIAGDDGIDAAEMFHALLWPVLLPWFLIDVARGWRP